MTWLHFVAAFVGGYMVGEAVGWRIRWLIGGAILITWAFST